MPLQVSKRSGPCFKGPQAEFTVPFGLTSAMSFMHPNIGDVPESKAAMTAAEISIMRINNLREKNFRISIQTIW